MQKNKTKQNKQSKLKMKEKELNKRKREKNVGTPPPSKVSVKKPVLACNILPGRIQKQIIKDLQHLSKVSLALTARHLTYRNINTQ
jgi:hypothetical protein